VKVDTSTPRSHRYTHRADGTGHDFPNHADRGQRLFRNMWQGSIYYIPAERFDIFVAAKRTSVWMEFVLSIGEESSIALPL
jgi:hypothetical protein